MKEISLNGTLRKDLGKKASREIRKQDLVPCVIYGVEKDEKGLPVAQSFTVTNKELAKLLYTPNVYIVNLNLEGKPVKAILKALQTDFVTDRPLHVDFYQITNEKPVVMEIPIKLNGLAEGVKAGGKLQQQMRKLKVKALYTDIPEVLNVDVTSLGLGKSTKVADLSYDGLELINPKSAVVCMVKATRAAMNAAANQ